MSRRQSIFVIVLGLLVCAVWGTLFSAIVEKPVDAAPLTTDGAVEISPTLARDNPPTPKTGRDLVLSPSAATVSTATPSRSSATRTSAPLSPLYVDGPYLRRSDNNAIVWLKGANVEEFRQRNPHTFLDLYSSQGLGIVVGENWGVNLLRVAVDPETLDASFSEYDKLIAYAEQQGMYVILTPFASATNPARNEVRLIVPDAIVANAMGRLAERYRTRANVIYALWNEPHPETLPSAGYDQQWQVWMNAATSVARSIRSKNPNSVLVVPGGTKWGRDLTFYRDHPFPFENIVYDVHDYWASPDYHYTRDLWTWAIGKYPILIGEFGGNPVNPTDPISLDYMRDTIQIVNQNPGMVHYAMYALTDDGAWGIFTRGMSRMPKGDLLLQDLKAHPPTLAE